jgi:PAS domain-containing protein
MHEIKYQNQNEHTQINFFKDYWPDSWIYTRTVVDIIRQPVMILDDKCTVLSANEAFYKHFKITPSEVELQSIYKIDNGQWNIPKLKKLLGDILPKNTHFKGFEVQHDFPKIGKRTIILNARKIVLSKDIEKNVYPSSIIMLALEDVTEILAIAGKLAYYSNELEEAHRTNTKKLEHKIDSLEKTIAQLKLTRNEF